MAEPPSGLARRRISSRPVRQYVLLGVLFVIAIGYHTLEARDTIHGLLHPESRYDLPFAVDPLTGTIRDPMSAEKWGIRRRDLLVAMDNLP